MAVGASSARAVGPRAKKAGDSSHHPPVFSGWAIRSLGFAVRRAPPVEERFSVRRGELACGLALRLGEHCFGADVGLGVELVELRFDLGNAGRAVSSPALAAPAASTRASAAGFVIGRKLRGAAFAELANQFLRSHFANGIEVTKLRLLRLTQLQLGRVHQQCVDR